MAGNGPAEPAVVAKEQGHSLDAGIPGLSSDSDTRSLQRIIHRLFPLSNPCSREDVKII